MGTSNMLIFVFRCNHCLRWQIGFGTAMAMAAHHKEIDMDFRLQLLTQKGMAKEFVPPPCNSSS
jgi:hypothetical protein